MNEIAAAILGFAGGMVGGLLGVGGGVLFVPALVIFMDETQVRAEATSLLAIVPVALVAVWRQRGYGNVRVRDGLVIGALSPLGVAIGVVTSNEISQRALELIFAGLALVIATQLVFRAQAGPRARLEALLEGALDAGVQGVQPVEGERLWDGEAAATGGATDSFRAVVREQTVEKRRAALRRQVSRSRAHDFGAQRQVPHQASLLGDPKLGPIGELARLADVVEERRGHQQVRVQARMQLADLEHQRRHGDRVLDQPTNVGVMAGAGAGRAAKLRTDGIGEQNPLDHLAQRRVVDLAGQVLEEALELLGVAVRGGQEVRRVELSRLDGLDFLDLGHQLPAEALHPAGDANRVTTLEAPREAIDLPECPRRDRSCPVAQLHREVDRAVPGGEAVLADAGVDPAEALAGPQLGDPCRFRGCLHQR